MFKEGDKVVYPHHGAGQILEVQEKQVLGRTKKYLTIKIVHNEMTVMVPAENVEEAGIRRVVSNGTVEEVLSVLREGATIMPKNWNRRFKHNRDKIKTGDIFEVADVVRNLALREAHKGLSTGEKQMFTRVKRILASELMYAMEKSEMDACEFLDSLLEEVCSQTAEEQ